MSRFFVPDPTVTAWGYHGTLSEYVPRILKDGFQIQSNPWDWLGQGVYFWQDAKHRAIDWARSWHSRRRREPKVAVIRAKILLEDCLDLLDVGWNTQLQKISPIFQQRLRDEGKTLENHRSGQKQGRHELDCAFFNFVAFTLSQEGQPVSSIRAAVTEGEAILDHSPICYHSHVQIAVRSLSVISDLTVIYDESKEIGDHA